eukprot:IDg64t1
MCYTSALGYRDARSAYPSNSFSLRLLQCPNRSTNDDDVTLLLSYLFAVKAMAGAFNCALQPLRSLNPYDRSNGKCEATAIVLKCRGAISGRLKTYGQMPIR